MPDNNPLERILREIGRRTRVVGSFPDGQSALNLAAAGLRHIAGTAWSTSLNLAAARLRHIAGSQYRAPLSPNRKCENRPAISHQSNSLGLNSRVKFV